MKLDDFIAYRRAKKGQKENTLHAYVRDIQAFARYAAAHGKEIDHVTKTDVISYLMKLEEAGKSNATSNRALASLRAYFHFLLLSGEIRKDPTEGIRGRRAARRVPTCLSVAEVGRLLSLPDKSCKGLRDKAILETLYGTGVRVVELVEMNQGDLDLTMDYISCSGRHGSARIVPVGAYAKKALTAYMEEARPMLLKGAAAEDPAMPLFVNYAGKRFTRQGLWKVIGSYGEKAGLAERLNPHILRTSFAVHMLQNGADLKTVQELLGYDDVQAMQVFLSLSTSRLKDVYDKTHPRA